MTTGRNSPCPCGSGLKFKRCCLNKERADPAPSAADAPQIESLGAELRREMSKRNFASLEAVQMFADHFMEQRNARPVPEFAGLSAEQMRLLLHQPFDAPELLQFAPVLSVRPQAPVMDWLAALLPAIGAGKPKATAKGFLPRTVCRAVAIEAWGLPVYEERMKYHKVVNERDVDELHTTRLLAQLAGLLRKYQGRFVLTRKCEQLLRQHGLAGLYPLLFRAAAQEFNWAYRDRYDELRIVQQSFAFSLFLLKKNAGRVRADNDYCEDFISAYPAALDEISPDRYFEPHEEVAYCYKTRFLDRFAQFFGLVTLHAKSSDLLTNYDVQVMPLLDDVVKYRL